MENYWQMTHSNYAYTEVTVLRDLLKTNFEITIFFLYLFVCMYGHKCAISSLLPVHGSGGNWTQVTSRGSKCPYPLSYLTGPNYFSKRSHLLQIRSSSRVILIGSCTYCLSYVIENYKNLKTKPKLFFLLLLFSQSNQTTMKSPQELVFT